MKERDIDYFEDTAEECVKRWFSALHCPQPDFCHKPLSHTPGISKPGGIFKVNPKGWLSFFQKISSVLQAIKSLKSGLLFLFSSFLFFLFTRTVTKVCNISHLHICE